MPHINAATKVQQLPQLIQVKGLQVPYRSQLDIYRVSLDRLDICITLYSCGPPHSKLVGKNCGTLEDLCVPYSHGAVTQRSIILECSWNASKGMLICMAGPLKQFKDIWNTVCSLIEYFMNYYTSFTAARTSKKHLGPLLPTSFFRERS